MNMETGWKMHVELDLGGIYYFVWSLVFLGMICAIDELLDKIQYSRGACIRQPWRIQYSRGA